MNVPTFDSRLDYSDYLRDPQVFLGWLHNMDQYFTQHSLSEMEKGSLSRNWLDKRANTRQMWKETRRPNFKHRLRL